MKRRVVVVGASLAGVRTVAALRRHGFDGDLVLVGAETELPYDRPPLSKDTLAGTAELRPTPLEPPEFYAGIDLRLGVEARRLRLGERAVLLSDGTTLRGDDIVLATGSVARRLPLLDGVPGVFTLRTIEDARRIHDALPAATRVAVVGGGFIGCEVAATLRATGRPVTVIEAREAPNVRGVGVLVGQLLAQLHREQGVDVRTRVSVTGYEQSSRDHAGAVRALRLSDGSQVEADLVVVGIGTNPRMDWLDRSGLTLGSGVVCDGSGRAYGGGGHVWAVGEVADWPSRRWGRRTRFEHWAPTVEQSGVVADAVLHGGSAAELDPMPYLSSDQYGHRFQVFGSVLDADELTLRSGSLRDRRFAIVFSRAGRPCAVVVCDVPDAAVWARQELDAAHAKGLRRASRLR